MGRRIDDKLSPIWMLFMALALWGFIFACWTAIRWLVF